MGCIGWIGARIICLINLSFFIGGGFLLGFGIYLAVESAQVTFTDVTLSGAPDLSMWLAAVYMAITAAALAFVSGVLGHCGRVKENLGCMNAYTSVVILGLLVEITFVILAIVFYNQFTIGLMSNMKLSVRTQYTNPNATSSNNPDHVSYNWNVLQSKLQCCGSVGPQDYVGSNFTSTTGYQVPFECCVRNYGISNSDMNIANVNSYSQCQTAANQSSLVSQYLYTQGCYLASQNWAYNMSNILIGIGIVFAILQLVALLLSRCFKNKLEEMFTV